MANYPICPICRKLRKAFTLMELLVVLVILVLLAALIIPRIVGVTEQANASTNANTLAGVNRAVQQFITQYGKLPDTWDYVLDENDAPYKLHPNVAPLVQVLTLTDLQRQSLQDAGWKGGHFQDSAYVGNPHESIKGWRGLFMSNAKALALVKPTTFGGHYKDFPDRAFGINQFRVEAFKSEYIVAGLAGPTSLRGNSIMESPIIQSANPQTYYARVLCVFRVPASDGSQVGFKAQYMGCFAPDGTTTNDNINQYNTSQVPLN